MIFSKIIEFTERLSFYAMLAFSFFSAIFCGFTRVNNLFHLAAFFFLLTLATRPGVRSAWLNRRAANAGMALVACFLAYYAVSNLWGGTPDDTASTLTHGVYILLYLALLVTVLESPERNLLLCAVIAGITLLCLYLACVDFREIYSLRETSGANPGPRNVIDLAGYAALGIILSLMVFRDTGKKRALSAIPLLFAFMVFTQSRGPLMALLAALALTTSYLALNKKSLLAIAAAVLFAVGAVLFSPIGEMLITRFEELYQQSFVRMSIWRHSLLLVEQAPFFGYGFDKQLTFTNYTGEFIHTTHSLYLGALLKGGLVGFCLFAALLTFGAQLAVRHLRAGRRLEAALYLFMLIFYCSQGMFVIANPAEFWYLFWFPLAMVFAQPPLISPPAR
ncbi:TPA: O-antigen ligase family protein [Serratia liquefaciens]|uniref:O-antigen ligase family protein n=1 Tax=Serratia liquefaciens TaxID=614 RepID=UPI0021841568|nr:O-antigen ligase family protein [Serratia liquefaciens]CAI2411217.1 Lipid A core - O-antigen ligase and related enzymes [Serratia liquefaciens]HED2334515.1 O-antigen ligase family protein [Serratia liquefaciens]